MVMYKDKKLAKSQQLGQDQQKSTSSDKSLLRTMSLRDAESSLTPPENLKGQKSPRDLEPTNEKEAPEQKKDEEIRIEERPDDKQVALDEDLTTFRDRVAKDPSLKEQLKDPTFIRMQQVGDRQLKRLAVAQKCIEHINRNVMTLGAGNQKEDIVATQGVSRQRAQLSKTHNIVDNGRSTKDGAEESRATVKAEHWNAGVCDDYAKVTMDYLRKALPGETLTRVGHDKHAFVIIGDRGQEQDSDLVVADPWPTRPQACLWTDHFCFTKGDVKVNSEMVADGKTDKKQAKREVKFKEKGQRAKQSRQNDKQVEEVVKTARKYDDIWFQRTSTNDDKAVFYYNPNWTEKQRETELKAFKRSLYRSRHLNKKALRRHGL